MIFLSPIISKSYLAALVLAVGLSFFFDLPRISFAILLGLAFCFGLHRANLLKNYVAIGLLFYAGIVLVLSILRANDHSFTMTEMFLIQSGAFYKLMAGFWVCVIGAAFIFITKAEK